MGWIIVFVFFAGLIIGAAAGYDQGRLYGRD